MNIRLKPGRISNATLISHVTPVVGDAEYHGGFLRWWRPGTEVGEKIYYSDRDWEEVPIKKWVPIRTMIRHDDHISIYKDGSSRAIWSIPPGIRVTQVGPCHLEISEEVPDDSV